MRFAATSFRPVFGRVLAVVTAIIAAFGLGGFVVSGDWGGLARYGWGLALLAALGFALFWFPRLDIAEREVTVVNVFSTVHVPWQAIERVDTKWALTLYLAGGGKVEVWASPAPSRYAGQVSMSRDARLAADTSGGDIRPGDLLSTASGAAAYLIRRHWEDLRESGQLDSSGSTVRRDVHWRTVAVLTALAIATAPGILL